MDNARAGLDDVLGQLGLIAERARHLAEFLSPLDLEEKPWVASHAAVLSLIEELTGVVTALALQVYEGQGGF